MKWIQGDDVVMEVGEGGVPEEVETRTSQIKKTRSYVVGEGISWEVVMT